MGGGQIYCWVRGVEEAQLTLLLVLARDEEARRNSRWKGQSAAGLGSRLLTEEQLLVAERLFCCCWRVRAVRGQGDCSQALPRLGGGVGVLSLS